MKLLDHVDPFPFDAVSIAINHVEGSRDEKRRAAVEQLLPGSGTLLPSKFLISFITAEITVDQAIEEMADRKKFIKRACYILPTLFRITNVKKEEELVYVLQLTVDCCNDIPYVAGAVHKKRGKREILKNLQELLSNLDQLTNQLQANKRQIDYEFEGQIKSVWQRNVRFEDFENEVLQMKLATQHVLFLDEVGEFEIFVTDNRVRTHVVEYAYRVSSWIGSPPFLTTPGSDFSLFCALLYELATGLVDASFNGAVGKFARSPERKQIDEDNKETNWENSDEAVQIRESDNFAPYRNADENLQHQLQLLQRFRDWVGPDLVADKTISVWVAEALEEHKAAKNRHGPFLVWASQISPKEWQDMAEKAAENENRMLKLEMELGQLRRNRPQK